MGLKGKTRFGHGIKNKKPPPKEFIPYFKLCSICKIKCTTQNCGTRFRKESGIYNWCARCLSCSNEKTKQYNNTKEGKLNQMLSDSIKHTVERLKTSREHIDKYHHNLTKKQIEDLCDKQNDCCFW